MTGINDGLALPRRVILQGVASVALVGLGKIAFGAAPAFAAANDKYPEEAFKQKSVDDAIKLLYGKTAEKSDKIKLDAPEIAENGSVVPISVSSTLRRRDLDRVSGRRESERAGGGVPNSRRHDAERGQSHQDGADQQRHRRRRSRRQALQHHQGSQSHRRRLRRLTRMIRKSGNRFSDQIMRRI